MKNQMLYVGHGRSVNVADATEHDWENARKYGTGRPDGAPPADPVQAARAAVKALAYARDCLKAAGTKEKSIDRVRHALSSAKGAVRAAEYRRSREARKAVMADLPEGAKLYAHTDTGNKGVRRIEVYAVGDHCFIRRFENRRGREVIVAWMSERTAEWWVNFNTHKRRSPWVLAEENR